EYLVLVAYDLVHCECNRGRRHVDDHIDLIDVDPRAHDVRADVRLVLVVGADDFDFHAFGGGGEILDRHPGRKDGALAAEIGIRSRHVVHDADLDASVAILCLNAAAPEHDRECREGEQSFHKASSC